LKNNYINKKKEKKIDIVLTRISNMVNFLKSEKKQIILGNFYLIKFMLILKKKFTQFLKIA